MPSYDPDSYWQNRGGEKYRDYVESTDYSVYRQEQDQFFTRLVTALKPHSLLDFACGTGKLFMHWRNIPDVHGYDRAASQLSVAQSVASTIERTHPYHLRLGESASRTELPYADNQFDVVVAAEVMLHILPEDIEPMIAELHRVCRGHLAIVTAAPFDNPASHCFDHDYTALLRSRFDISDDHAAHRQRYLVCRRREVSSGTEPVNAQSDYRDKSRSQGGNVMPSSRPELIPFVVNAVMQLQPKSILEIGTGFGKYGFLFREYLDIWGAASDPNRLKPENWQVRIDGIEVYEPYIGELQRQIYDRLIVGNAMTEIERLGRYDLIFLGDVIEHFPKEEGQRMLERCLEHATKAVLVTTPNYFNPQGAEYGNERETHHCLWTNEDFQQFPGAQCYVIEKRYNLAVIPVMTPADSRPTEEEPAFSFASE